MLNNKEDPRSPDQVDAAAPYSSHSHSPHSTHAYTCAREAARRFRCSVTVSFLLAASELTNTVTLKEAQREALQHHRGPEPKGKLSLGLTNYVKETNIARASQRTMVF